MTPLLRHRVALFVPFSTCDHFEQLVISTVSKEIGKAWRKRYGRGSARALSVFSLVPDLLFDCSRLLEYAKIRTVLQSTEEAKFQELTGKTLVVKYIFYSAISRVPSRKDFCFHPEKALHRLSKICDSYQLLGSKRLLALRLSS